MTISRFRFVGLVVLAVLGAVAATPWSLGERTIERHLLSRITDQLGLGSVTSASGSIALLPFPHFVAKDVRLTTADGLLSARIPQVRADIRLLSLIAGRIEFDQLSLSAPQIDLELAPEQTEVLDVIGSYRLAQLPSFPRIVIGNNGSVFLRRNTRIVSALRDINVEVAPHLAGDAVQTSGSLVWRGEKLDFAFASNSHSRGTLPMLKIKSDLVTVDFASARTLAANGAAMPVLDGQIQIVAKSMSRLSAWLASGSPVLLPLGNTAVSGRLRIADNGAQISSALVTIGTDVLDGGLDWRKRDSRWRLTGTLAGRSLDIGRPLAGVDINRIALPDFASTVAIDLDDLFAHDVDMRMSLQRVRLPGITLNDVATQIMISDRRADLSITHATLHGGVVRGRGSVSRTDTAIDIRTQLSAERVDLAPLSQEFFETRRLSGTGALQHNLESSGRTPAELVRNANGRLTLTARNGDFMGTNLNDAMRRIERQPLSVARDWRGGRTSFEQMSLVGVISNGLVEVHDARGNGTAFRISMDGQISLPEQLFRLNGQVQSNSGTTAIPFDIVGPLNEPNVQVNARAFLERSGAAAPMLPKVAN